MMATDPATTIKRGTVTELAKLLVHLSHPFADGVVRP